MFLNITNTGLNINQELSNYINEKFIQKGIHFNKIYTRINTKSKQIDIIYPNVEILNNTICINEEELSESIINWLENL